MHSGLPGQIHLTNHYHIGGLAMFGGWFALIAVSFLVYRCAAANRRRRWLWVLLLWISTFGCGIWLGSVVAIIYAIRGVDFTTETAAAEALVAPVCIGMLVGAIACVYLANRRPAETIRHPAGWVAKNRRLQLAARCGMFTPPPRTRSLKSRTSPLT